MENLLKLKLIFKICNLLEYNIQLNYLENGKLLYFTIMESCNGNQLYVSKEHSVDIALELAEEVLSIYVHKYNQKYITDEIAAIAFRNPVVYKQL